MNKLTVVNLDTPKAPRITPSGEVISCAQGQLGEKIIVSGIVLFQTSKAVDTLIGRTYSHFHIIKDLHGNLYQYRGSSFFPKGNKVQVLATVKGYCKGDIPKSVVTIIKAPKSL